jgi:diphthamide synthase (EF-2-diphthine--ammonia ligase)
MEAALARARSEGVTHVAFGDLFLADIRAYREDRLRGSGIEPLFPLWEAGRDTAALARAMIAGGLRAIITCVDPRQLPEAYVGRLFDDELLATLPSGVDPCGERGEFHTFCFAGPMFTSSIAVEVGEQSLRDGFCFADVRPAAS